MDFVLEAYRESLKKRNVPVLISANRLNHIELTDSLIRREHHLSLYGPSISLVSGEMIESCMNQIHLPHTEYLYLFACLNDYLNIAYKNHIIQEIPWRGLVPSVLELEADPLVDGKTDPTIDFLSGDFSRSLKPHIFDKYMNSFKHYLCHDKPERYWNVYLLNSVQEKDGSWKILDVRFIQRAIAPYWHKTDNALIYNLFIDYANGFDCYAKEYAHGLWVGYSKNGKPLCFAVHADNNIFVPDEDIPSWFGKDHQL